MEVDDKFKARLAMEETIRKNGSYVTCRLILDELLKIGLDNLYIPLEPGTAQCLGIIQKSRLKMFPELCLVQLASQLKFEVNFSSEKDTKEFIKAADAFLKIFETEKPKDPDSAETNYS